jgi:hypothetical protein
MNADEIDDLDTILKNKEQELKEIQMMKIRSLEAKLAEKDKNIAGLEQRYADLQQDFNYNLIVIEQRDKDISELCEKMNSLREILEEKEKVIISLDEEKKNIQAAFQIDLKRIQEQTRPLYDKIEELKQENKFYKNSHNEETLQLGREVERLKKALQTEVDEKELTKKNFENSLRQTLEANGKELQQRLLHSERMVESLLKEKETTCNESQKHVEKLLQETERLREELNSLKKDSIDRQADLEKQNVELRIKNKV